ncbi:MAG TPA: putative Ig domain-containing protein [Bryobacteraceae bacterium]|nr:putative Ig domain-containing protein [Bryobacteraceae bacterium]
MRSRGIAALLFLASAGMLTAQISPTTAPNGTMGDVYFLQLTETQIGGPSPVAWGIMSGGLPPGLTLNTATTAATTTITGTPTTPGLYSFVVEAEYDDSSPTLDTQSFTIDVRSGFSISTTSLPTATVGAHYSQQLQTMSAEGTVAWYICPPDANCFPGGIPAPGLTLNGSSGVISGTPTTTGVFTFTVQAEYNDSATFTATRQLSINVVNATPPPTCVASLLPATLPQGEINLRYTPTQFTVNGCPGPYSFTALPAGTINGNALPPGLSLTNGLLAGTPGQTGTFTFFIMANTASGPNQISAESEYSVVINTVPTITTASPLPSGDVGALYSQQISATGGVPPYTFSMDANPPGITISPAGLLGGTPTATGTFPFNIGVTDSLGGQTSSPFQVSFVVGTPEVEVSPLSLIFNADFQGRPPGSQAIAVTPASGTKPPANFSVLVDDGQSSSAAPAWISVSPTGASAPAGLVVNVNQGALAAGAYPARVRVVDSNNLPTDVSVTLNVSNNPQQLTVSPSMLRFGARAAAPGILVQDLLVSNTGASTLAFNATVTNGSSWISAITPNSGQTVLGGAVPLQVQVNTSGLAIGNYHDNLHLASTAGNVDIPISLFVAASGPVISVIPTGVFFHARQNGGTSATRNFEILNIGDPNSAVNWTATLVTGSNWLNLVSSSGTATASTPGVLTAAPVPNATQLALGPYYALIQITDPNSLNSPQFAIAVLNVDPDSVAPSPDVLPGGLFYTAPAGGSAPPAQQVAVNTSSAAPIPFQVATTAADQGSWLSATPSSGNASGTDPGNVAVSVNPTGLAAGIYTGSVNVSIGQLLESVNVTFVVQPTGSSGAITHSRPEVSGCTASKLAITENGLVNNFAVPAGWPATLIAQLNDDCAAPVTNGNVIASFSNGDAPLVLVGDSLGNYTATWQPGNVTQEMEVTLNAAAGTLQPAVAKLYGGIAQNQTPPPTLAPSGTLNNLNPIVGAALSPGIIAQVYGSGLAASSTVTGILPLPTLFNNTFAQVGAYQAPLYFLSSGQFNVQLPAEIAASQQVPIILSVNSALTLPVTLDIVPTTPGVLSLLDGPTPPSVQNGAHIIAQHLDGSLVNSNSPGKPGEYLVMYLVGLGATNPAVPSGQPAPASPLSNVTVAPTVTVDSLPSNVLFAGLTPGFAGLYQIDFQVPTGAASGEDVVTVTQNGIAANPTLLAVSQ